VRAIRGLWSESDSAVLNIEEIELFISGTYWENGSGCASSDMGGVVEEFIIVSPKLTNVR
jgi:hypothetical protein